MKKYAILIFKLNIVTLINSFYNDCLSLKYLKYLFYI